MIGGIFADQILWPYFIERPLFQKYDLEQTPIYITEKKETTLYVQENMALRNLVKDVEQIVVGVKTKMVSGEVVEGSGLVLTSDGLIITLASLVPKGAQFYFFIDDEWQTYQVLKRDLKNDLALVKLEAGSLKTRGFADLEKVKLAEPVFFVGADFSQATSTGPLLYPPNKRVNYGIITFLAENIIETNMSDALETSGSPVFNFEGRVVGLSSVAENGKVSVVPVDIIRTFAGF